MTPEEKARHYGVPLIPKRSAQPNQGVIAICGECGLEMRGAMGYVCPRINCPTGLGPTTSMSSPIGTQHPGGQVKWCSHCRKTDHSDTECWSTRIV